MRVHVFHKSTLARFRFNSGLVPVVKVIHTDIYPHQGKSSWQHDLYVR